MKYLLDTCTVSDFVKGQPSVLQRVRQTDPRIIAVSAITRMEIEYGLALNAERARKLAPVLNAFFAAVDNLGFDVADAEASASLRAGLRVQGQPIGPYDVLIAGTAFARGLTIITSNVGEFGRIPGLRVENWR